MSEQGESKTEILEQSFQLMRKVYEEMNASAESINTRSGITLALLGAFLTTADLKPWSFYRPPYQVDWPLWLILNVLSLISMSLFAAGVSVIYLGYKTKQQDSPYDLESLAQQKEENGNAVPYAKLDVFYKQQMSNTKAAVDAYRKTLDEKARRFNAGLAMALVAIGLAVVGKLIK